MEVSGIVDNIETRKVTLKSGPRAGKAANVYTIFVDDVSNGVIQIDGGFNKPTVSVGELYKGMVSDSPNRFGKYEVVKSNGSAPASKSSGSPSSGKQWVFPVPKDDHATSICRQSALKAAVDIYGLTIENVPSEEEAVNGVLRIASRFANWTTGQAEVEEAERIIAEKNHEPSA